MREQANKATGRKSSAFRRLREASKSTSVLSFGVGALYGVLRLSHVPCRRRAGQWELAIHQMGCSSESSGVVATSNEGTQLVISNLVPKSGRPPAVAVETPNCHPLVVYH